MIVSPPVYLDLQPPAPLRAGVRRMSFFHEATEGGTTRREPPRGHATLIIGLADPIAVSAVDADAPPLAAFAVGAAAGPLTATCGANNSGIEIQLRPWFAAHLLGADILNASSEVMDVTDLLPAGLASLREVSPSSLSDRVAIVYDWLRRRLAMAQRDPRPEVIEAWRLLEISAGTVSIAGLAAHLGYSHRHFKDLFSLETGLGPKRAARLLRFGHALELIESVEALSLSEIAHACGYSDQSHLTREFRTLAATSPATFSASRLAELQGFGDATV